MRKLNLFSFALFILLTVLAFSNADAQQPTPEPQGITDAKRPVRLLQELGLSREQIQQIRRINQNRKPIMQEAQQNLRLANRNLDAAIYADEPNEQEVQARMKEVQLAQAEVIKARTMTEFMIRKVLKPEQLQKFRELRERMQQQRQNMQENQQQRQNQRRQNQNQTDEDNL